VESEKIEGVCIYICMGIWVYGYLGVWLYGPVCDCVCVGGGEDNRARMRVSEGVLDHNDALYNVPEVK